MTNGRFELAKPFGDGDQEAIIPAGIILSYGLAASVNPLGGTMHPRTSSFDYVSGKGLNSRNASIAPFSLIAWV